MPSKYMIYMLQHLFSPHNQENSQGNVQQRQKSKGRRLLENKRMMVIRITSSFSLFEHGVWVPIEYP